MLASMAGALTIGAAAFGFACISSALKGTGEPRCGAWMVVGPLLGGMTGSLVDSVLGAAVQATHYCPRCAEETEKTLHGCGTRTIYQRGWRWLNNDMVNLISSLAGAFVSGVLFLLW